MWPLRYKCSQTAYQWRKVLMFVGGKSKSRNWSVNNSSKRPGISDKILCEKLLRRETDTNCRICQQFAGRIKYITSASWQKNNTWRNMLIRVCAQLHFNIWKGIGGRTGQKRLVWTSTKTSRNKSWRQGNYIIKWKSANGQSHP